MGKVIQWESQIDGNNYSFAHERIKGKHVLTINGNPIEIKGGFISTFLGFDEEFMLDGRKARLVIEKKVPDIVIDGKFLQSGKIYKPRPRWVIVFAALSGILIFIGGALGVLIGICSAALCVGVSKTSLPTVVRVILCTITTVAAWILMFVLAVGINMLL